MSPDVLLECPRTSFGDVLRVNVTERVWHLGLGGVLASYNLKLIKREWDGREKNK